MSEVRILRSADGIHVITVKPGKFLQIFWENFQGCGTLYVSSLNGLEEFYDFT
jgi:hypothetical protein